MHISQMIYEHGTTKKEFMALVVGNNGNKTILIDDKFIDESDASLIRKNYDNISNFSIPNQVKWIRENCPKSYKGYKEIYSERLKIINVFDIKKL
jgi:hypothetical protein